MTFTPIESSIGGILVATSLLSHALFQGKVTGTSGILRYGTVSPILKLFDKSKDASYKYHILKLLSNILWSYAYLIPLILTGLLSYAEPKNFITGQVADFSNYTWKFAIAGFFVGLGTFMGGGCTSGHMISGVSRLSKRSFVATGVFCGTVLLLTQAQWSFYELKPRSGAFVSLPSITMIIVMVCACFITFSGYIILFFLTRIKKDFKLFAWLLQILDGLTFGFGMVISGMVSPSKVGGFFAFGNWDAYDPSLFCVAAFGIFPTMLVYQFYLLPQQKSGKKTLLGWKYDFPTNTTITLELVLGACFFGIGWGLLYLCPAPTLVNAGAFRSPNVWIWLVTFLVGSFSWGIIDRVRKFLKKAFSEQPELKSVNSQTDSASSNEVWNVEEGMCFAKMDRKTQPTES